MVKFDPNVKHDLPAVTDAIYGNVHGLNEAFASGLNPNLHARTNQFPGDTITLMTVAISTGQRSIVQDLVDHGARVQPGDQRENAPLVQAAGLGEYDIVQFFLDHGASVSQTDIFDHTALWEAQSNNSSAVETLLLAHGAGRPGRRARVLARTDLTHPFGTRSRWTVVVEQDESPLPNDDPGPIFICFSKTPTASASVTCSEGNVEKRVDSPVSYWSARVVYAGRAHTQPLILIKTCGGGGINGNCGVSMSLYDYDRARKAFHSVFSGIAGGSNNNSQIRFVEQGPLRGDVISDAPTSDYPYGYWITVYGRKRTGRYVQILHYRGRTGYGDGNPLAVIDSDMPEILRRFGLWRPGDALPVPPHMPKRCSHLFMRRGEEWCR